MAIAAATAVAAAATSRTDAGEWSSYGRDHSEQRFSPLDAINTHSVSSLGLKWWTDLPQEGALVATPLMVGGVLYFSGLFGVVYAVDARDGHIKWRYDPKAADAMAKYPPRLTMQAGVTRGVAYWDGRIFVGASDGRLIALQASTGQELWSVQTFDPKTPRYITGAPLAFNGKVLIGHGGADFGPVRGYVTAYDARTGRQLWRFYTVPGNPADGFENDAMRMAAKTWTGEWWRYGGGGTVWNSMTYDRQLNRVYLGTGNGSPWNRDVRSPGGGDNLFLASVVALDADSGAYVWHYQENPGEQWDYNSDMDMVLADLVIAGKPRRVLLHAPKNGFFYVIDRDNGRLISAESFVRTTWAAKIDLQSGRPVETESARPGKGATSIAPGPVGGHSWPSMSYNASTGLVYIPTLDLVGHYDAKGIDPAHWNPKPFDLRWTGYSDVFGRSVDAANPGGLTSWAGGEGDQSGAFLQARDPVSNRTVWQVRQPGLWAGGTLTTRGGLVFIGQANGHLVGYDARTGAELWSFDAQLPITAPPIAYELDGVEYISVLVGWGGTPGYEGSLADPARIVGYHDGGRRLVTFTLQGQAKLPPRSARPVVPLDVPGFEPDPVKVRRGEGIFDLACSSCHGTNVVSGGGAPDLRASPLAREPATLEQILMQGILNSRGMPRFQDFTRANVDDLYHYIRSRARQDLH